MRKTALLCITIVAMASFSTDLMAADLETHSVYKVTTYNLGALIGQQNSANLNVRNYEPLLITSTKADILNDQQVRNEQLSTTPRPNSTQGFAVAAEYNASSQLAVQGVFGVTKNNWAPSSLDQNSSWEANLGVVYRLLDNLNYELHFGYMATGDLLKERSSYSDTESIIMISNKLSMSF